MARTIVRNDQMQTERCKAGTNLNVQAMRSYAVRWRDAATQAKANRLIPQLKAS